MPFPLAVFLVYHCFNILMQSAQLMVLRACKLRVEHVQLFYGKPVAAVDMGSTRVVLGWFPMGSYIRQDPTQFASLPTPARVALILLGPVILLGVALSLLGPEETLHHFVTGFRQFVEGILHPQSVGYALFGKLHALYVQSPAAMAGVISAKGAAWALLPIGTAGAPVLKEIFSPDVRPREGVDGLISMGMMVYMLAILMWLGIFVVYAVNHWA
ncbi:hypothetical protein OKA04_15425 [Luteolibacter flavescens]|uniref:Uncharacterized protein n=1 Tax=Luteolibacter flavescens TaxID=1859460 RepID=A0ABT3FRC0_9BACT|nr:hypothetical protein [Luteolibacter flavescens]MCW1886128.1 hypothetical protein [Luteolibacter flavescens]